MLRRQEHRRRSARPAFVSSRIALADAIAESASHADAATHRLTAVFALKLLTRSVESMPISAAR